MILSACENNCLYNIRFLAPSPNQTHKHSMDTGAPGLRAPWMHRGSPKGQLRWGTVCSCRQNPSQTKDRAGMVAWNDHSPYLSPWTLPHARIWVLLLQGPLAVTFPLPFRAEDPRLRTTPSTRLLIDVSALPLAPLQPQPVNRDSHRATLCSEKSSGFLLQLEFSGTDWAWRFSVQDVY